MPWVCTCGQSNNDEEYPCSACSRFVDDEPDAVIAPVGRRFKAAAPAPHAAPSHQSPALFDQKEDDAEDSIPVGRRFKTAAASAAPPVVVMPAVPQVDPEEQARADRRALVARLAEEGRAEEARKKEEARKAVLARLNAEAEANERMRAENARLQEARRAAEEKVRAEEAARLAAEARAEEERLASIARAEEQARAEEVARAEEARAEQARAEEVARAEEARAEQARAEQARAEQARAEQARAEQARAEQARAEEVARAEQVRAEEEAARAAEEERAATAHRLADESSVAHPDTNFDWLEDDAWFKSDETEDEPEPEETTDSRAWFFERLAANADSVHIESEPMVEKLDQVQLAEAWDDDEDTSWQDKKEESFDWFNASGVDEASVAPVAEDPDVDVVDPYGLEFADWSSEDYGRNDEVEATPTSSTNWWDEAEDEIVEEAPAAKEQGRVSPKPVAWNEFDENIDLDSPDESEIERKRKSNKAETRKAKRPAPRTVREPIRVSAPFFAGLFQQHSRVVKIAVAVVVIGLLGTVLNGLFNRANAQGEVATGTTCALGGSYGAHDPDDFGSLFSVAADGLDATPDYSSNGGAIDFSQALQRESDLGGALSLLESTRFLSGFSRTFEGGGNTAVLTLYEFANPICADDYLKKQPEGGPGFPTPFGISSVGYTQVQGDKTLYVVRTVQDNTLLTTAFIGGNAETGPAAAIKFTRTIADRMNGGEDSGVLA